MKGFTPKEDRTIIADYPTVPTPLIAKRLSRTISSIRTRAQRLGVVKKIHSNNPYTPEVKKKLIKLYPDTKNTEIAKILGVTESSVKAAGFRFKLRKSTEFMRKYTEVGMFKKGQEPPNKGKKMPVDVYKKVQRTFFNKGHIPTNHRPIGSERLTKDGYLEIKVAEPNKWQPLHRVIWEETFGEIPKGMIVQFVTKDKMNLNPWNLELLPRSENMKRNSVHRYPKQISNTIQLIGALNRQINKQ